MRAEEQWRCGSGGEARPVLRGSSSSRPVRRRSTSGGLGLGAVRFGQALVRVKIRVRVRAGVKVRVRVNLRVRPNIRVRVNLRVRPHTNLSFGQARVRPSTTSMLNAAKQLERSRRAPRARSGRPAPLSCRRTHALHSARQARAACRLSMTARAQKRTLTATAAGTIAGRGLPPDHRVECSTARRQRRRAARAASCEGPRVGRAV